jgi:hypothetical protein
MKLRDHLHHDHQELRALAHSILHSASGSDAGGRENQFDHFDTKLRRHLAVFEEAVMSPLTNEEGARPNVQDVEARHREVRDALGYLSRSDKGSTEWAAEFRNLMQTFESLCHRHEALAERAMTMEGGRHSAELSERYKDAKLRQMKGGKWSWNKVSSAVPEADWTKVGVGVGVAAAVAGAAFAASRLFRGDGRSGSPDDFELRLETDENMRLISSKKVEGTPVVARDGARLGTIESFMVDKHTGRVAYAVMRFGGAFGFGSSLFPLPWPLLDYEEEHGGYVLNISKEEMADAPRFEANDEPEFDAEFRRSVLVFYRPSSPGTGYNLRQDDASGETRARQTEPTS